MSNTKVLPTDLKLLHKELEDLRHTKRAILLGHYYTHPEVQDVCDYVGDSLGLSREAAKSNAEIIVFCGVHFMAETASILAQDKKVLLPSFEASCSLANGITGEALAAWREVHPEHFVISYVNTTAEVKAYTDCCCTSSNALQVVQRYAPHHKLLFAPDRNLGRYIQKKTGVEMEALHGVSVALLTIYDMCKAIDKSMVIFDIHLMEKTGGKSGDFKFEDKDK